MKYLDKLKKELKINKKGLGFLIGISLIGFIFGCFFIIIISKSDKLLVKEYIESFLKNLNTNKINYFDIFKNTLLNNLLFIFVIFLLGMSVIGIPINIFYYFLKSFVLGFTMVSFILTYKIKGCLFSLLYVIPHNLINICIFTVLVYYSINFSILLIYAITKKKNINFKIIVNKYLKILLVTILIILITSIYESLVLPNIMKNLLFIIK
jgi:stage II sporulation protein M